MLHIEADAQQVLQNGNIYLRKLIMLLLKKNHKLSIIAPFLFQAVVVADVFS